jgi:hypothetical protein
VLLNQDLKMTFKIKILTGCLPLIAFLVLNNTNLVFGSPGADVKLSPEGSQPNIIIDNNQTVKITYGWEDKVYFSFSNNQGKTFTKPEVVGEIKDLQLAMTRSVQIAAGEKSTLIAATTKQGEIFSFHKENGKGWSGPVKINDMPGVAAEGFVTITNHKDNTFVAAWNDLRNKKGNELFGSVSKDGGKTWSKNYLIYKSPDGTVCECCKPSITSDNNGHLYLMFRNWINGSRDIYLASSADGKTFTNPQKQGTGNWKLQGCPMDGGSISVNGNKVKTLWQREGSLFYSEPGKPETEIAKGKLGSIAHSGKDTFMVWQDKTGIMAKTPAHKTPYLLSNGSYPKIAAFDNSHSAITVWETKEGIFAEKVK